MQWRDKSLNMENGINSFFKRLQLYGAGAGGGDQVYVSISNIVSATFMRDVVVRHSWEKMKYKYRSSL